MLHLSCILYLAFVDFIYNRCESFSIILKKSAVSFITQRIKVLAKLASSNLTVQRMSGYIDWKYVSEDQLALLEACCIESEVKR